jgi:ATP-binding cassette subfamily A (ABC1) protein 2
VPAYVEGLNFPAVISLFLLYGWSISPLMYPASFLFKESSNAYIVLIVVNLFTGITCVVSSFLFQVFAINSPDLDVIYQILKTVYLVFPPYCLGRGLIDIAYNDYYNIFYSKTGQTDKILSPFSWNIATEKLVSMAVIGAVSWVFTLLLEYDFFNHKKYKNCSKNTKIKHSINNAEVSDSTDELEQSLINEDVDVKKERLRVLNNIKSNYYPDFLIIKNLKKVYNIKSSGCLGLRKFFCCRKFDDSKNRQFTAVKDLCFGVPRGECFGLLGVNGAGKT